MKYLFVVTLLSIFMFPLFAMAEYGETECADIAASYPKTGKICYLLDNIADILYISGLVLAVIMVIIGGIKYMIAAESEDKVKNAKKTIIAGLIGAAIIMASGFILDTVAELIFERLIR